MWPMLFNLFITDIEVGIKSSIAVFADDTKLCQDLTLAQHVASLKEGPDKIGSWAATWQMRFNMEKCKVMHLGAKNTH